jgi:hypothetical protein
MDKSSSSILHLRFTIHPFSFACLHFIKEDVIEEARAWAIKRVVKFSARAAKG